MPRTTELNEFCSEFPIPQHQTPEILNPVVLELAELLAEMAYQQIRRNHATGETHSE
jgi:hypothetical protein